MVHPDRVHEAALRELFHAMADDVGVDGFVNNQTAIMTRPDSRPTLATIRCPALVLSGDRDMLFPISLAEEMAQGIAGAKLVIVPDCGHCPQPERPEATAEALVDWLRL
jgi:pimeloyl-ACP methyl ester carboxylesterase